MHLLVYTGQVSWRLNDKIFSRVGVLYNLNFCFLNFVPCTLFLAKDKLRLQIVIFFLLDDIILILWLIFQKVSVQNHYSFKQLGKTVYPNY